MDVKEMSANAKAALGGVMGLAFLIVILAAVFSDIAYIWMFHNVFPDGIFRIVSYVGVFATTLSVIGLFIGKLVWFRPGAQLICALMFAGIEAAVIVVNTIAAFSVARNGGSIDGNLQLWITYVSPSTPLIAMIGWFLITWFSPARAIAHKRMEMEDKLAEEDIAFQLETGRAQLALKRQYLQAGKAFMYEEINAPHIQKQVQQSAANSMADVLGSMTGQFVVPRRVVDVDELMQARQNGVNNNSHNGNGKNSKN